MKTNNNELVEMVFAVSRLMKGEMSYTNNLTHLSVLQIQTLFYLNRHEKTSMSDLAGYFHTELPSVTSLINKLCIKKLVVRREDSEDRRLVMVTLTSEGKKLLEDAMKSRRDKFEKLLSYLSEKEQGDLLQIFTTLRDKLQK